MTIRECRNCGILTTKKQDSCPACGAEEGRTVETLRGNEKTQKWYRTRTDVETVEEL